jgi:hypothetical protein
MKIHNGVLSLTQFPGQEYYLKADADKRISELEQRLEKNRVALIDAIESGPLALDELYQAALSGEQADEK